MAKQQPEYPETLTFCVSPDVAKVVRTEAKRDGRSVSNWLRVRVSDLVTAPDAARSVSLAQHQ